VAACFAAGLEVERCLTGLPDVDFTPLRGDEIEVGGVLLVDDTYNASPAAVGLALEDLAATATMSGLRAVAVLGDMLELGSEARRYHREAGARAAELGVRALWGIGPHSRATVDGFLEEAEPKVEGGRGRLSAPPGRNGGSVAEAPPRAGWVTRPEDAVDELVDYLRPGDMVLIKGSRGMKLDRLVAELTRRLGGGSEALPETGP
jgi:UDP-N-acetylmuramyl pentapeptide synthase